MSRSRLLVITDPSSRRLTRQDWTAAGLAALDTQGLAGVAIEPLAAKLGATKGSGYWGITVDLPH